MKYAVVAVAAVLCGGAAAQAQQPKVWRHGIVEAKGDAGFVMMAAKRGFDTKYGIKIELLSFKNGQIQVKGLISGELDSVESGAGEEIVAAGAGADIKVTGCSWPGLPHVILARNTIAKAADLKGKTIATSAPGSLPDLLGRALLDQSGVAATDVRLAAVGGDLDRYKALTAGIVDAAVVASEYLPVAPKDLHLLASGRELLPNFMRWCIATTGKTLASRGDDHIRFLAAQIDAFRYAVAHRDETIALTREITGAKADDPRPEYAFDQTVKEKLLDPELQVPTDKIDWMQQLFLKTGNLRAKFDTARMVDTAAREKALALVAAQK